MAVKSELKAMEAELCRLRDDRRAGGIDEKRLWRMLSQARDMQQRTTGGPLDECVSNIYELLESAWRITRSQRRLNKIAGQIHT